MNHPARSPWPSITLRYLASFAAGSLAGVVFWSLRTPTPVPPLIGLVGLLSIASGECATRRAIAAMRDRVRRGSRADTSNGEVNS